MEFIELIRRRRMVRRFDDRPLEPAVVERIVASALRAPSAGFAQGWAFLVLTEEADRERFWPFVPNQVNHTPELRNAPLVVVPLARKEAYLERYSEPDKAGRYGVEGNWPVPYWYIDTGMAALMMLLSAVDEGLDGLLCWLVPAVGEGEDLPVGAAVAAHLQGFRDEFGVPAEYTPIGAVAIGYRATDLPPQSPELTARRRGLQDVVHRGGWGK
ncbi:nitroreductase family protein [Longispora urticae]